MSLDSDTRSRKDLLLVDSDLAVTRKEFQLVWMSRRQLDSSEGWAVCHCQTPPSWPMDGIPCSGCQIHVRMSEGGCSTGFRHMGEDRAGSLWIQTQKRHGGCLDPDALKRTLVIYCLDSKEVAFVEVVKAGGFAAK